MPLSFSEISMKLTLDRIKAFLRNEDGVTAIEYGLIASLIGLVIIGGATVLGTNLNTKFSSIATSVGSAG
jgi:pilus assembly protein Flp/PilA